PFDPDRRQARRQRSSLFLFQLLCFFPPFPSQGFPKPGLYRQQESGDRCSLAGRFIPLFRVPSSPCCLPKNKKKARQKNSTSIQQTVQELGPGSADIETRTGLGSCEGRGGRRPQLMSPRTLQPPHPSISTTPCHCQKWITANKEEQPVLPVCLC
ncbi:hypothetical protein GGTG_09478, partial [Gaeumannomyces tritici R3-111a-1]